MARRLSPEEQARLKRIEKLEKELKKILLQAFYLSLTLPQIQKALKDADELFELKNSRPILRKITSILKTQFNKFNVTLLNGIQKEFEITNDDQWKNLEKRSSKTTAQAKAFDIIRTEATKTVRSIAEQARTFTNEKKGGFTLSERVWKNFENIPKELDVIVQNAIKEGVPAESVAKNLQKYLLDDKKLFRRVLNKKTGKLEWSKAAKNYHPGQGVYRSSFKNALRLIRTEINRAYREAEWNGYQNNIKIYGYEIVLSNNTENQCDVCKRLAGSYPKWFKWTGWHPQCRCRMIAVLMPREDFAELVRLRFQGKEKEFKPKFIDKLPDQFVSYIQENSERISKAASVPYWYEDNREKINKLQLV